MKKLIDIGPTEIQQCPVWVFPTDDQETVIPAESSDDLEDYQIIVRCYFHTNKSKEYVGFIYWGRPNTVEYIQPCMFFDETGESGIVFWNGMLKPSDEYIARVKMHLSEDDFPITYQSEPVLGLEQLEGTLEGIYYLAEDGSTHSKII